MPWAYVVSGWRSRWRSLLAVALLITLAGGATCAAVAGARRTATSPERFREAARSRDLFINGVPDDPAPLRRILDGPLVESSVDETFVFAFVDTEQDAYFLAPTSAENADIDRGVLLAGRRADPTEPLEVVVPERVADRYELEPGDALEAFSFEQEEADAILAGNNTSPPTGPDLPFEVTGIARTAPDLFARPDDPGAVLLSPAFLDAYEGEVGLGATNILVRLVEGRDGIDAFTDAADAAYGDDRVLGLDLSDPEGVLGQSLDVVVLALFLLAAVVAVVGAALVATAISRQERTLARDDAVLRALGTTPRGRTATLVAAVLPAVVAGAVLAPILAAVASTSFPIGVGRRFEPDAGTDIDLAVLGLGSVAVLGVGGLLALISARRVVRTRRSTHRRIRAGSSRLLGRATRALRPAPATGVRFALASPPAVDTPVRPALTGACVGTLALVAVAIVGASLDHLIATPARWGTTWDVAVVTDDVDRADVVDDDGIAAATMARFDEQVTVDDREVLAVTIDRVKGDLTPTVIEGEAPDAPDEVALGRDTLDAIGAGIGSTVGITSRSVGATEYRVVGETLFATVGLSFPLTDGALFTLEGGDRLRLGDPARNDSGYLRLLVRWAPDANRTDTLARIAPGTELEPPSAPPEVNGLRDVERFPAATAGVLALLGAFAVGHALSVTAQRRRRELGVLGAVGFRPAQRSVAVVTQATATGAVALVVGIPAGILVGRLAWALIAEALGVATDASVPVALLATGALVVVVLLHLLAIGPAIAARRIRVAEALRAE